MNYINENDMMAFYIQLLDNEQIEFLRGKPAETQEICRMVTVLIDCQNLHDRIDAAKILWKRLFEYSLSFIHPDKGGYDDLFDYFDAYVDFEELIFASDSFYRDHTLHCLWVYFLGEYLQFDEQFKDFVKPEQRSPINLIDNLLALMKHYKIDPMHYKDIESMQANIPCQDSIRCITALTHDLGYPLKKIKKINGGIKKVLPFYGLDDYNEFQFKYQPAHMNFIQQFLKLMSLEIDFTTNGELTRLLPNEWLERLFMEDGKQLVAINPDFKTHSEEENVKVLSNLGFHFVYRENTGKLLQYSLDFEKMQHGLMSAYILSRNLNLFKDMNLKMTSLNDVHLEKQDSRILYAMSEIFCAVADHTNDSYKITSLVKSSSYLSFIDEIEEFSRISRANQNRQFINEFCKTTMAFKDGVFVLNFVFNNMEIDNLDPERAFKGRCKRMLTLLDIPNLTEDFKMELNCIGELDYNKNQYTLQVAKKSVDILVNGVSQDIPSYLASRQFYTKEAYKNL